MDGGVRAAGGGVRRHGGKLAAREEELRIANQHLEELASLDGLTGLANRRGFDRELDAPGARAPSELRQPLA